MTDRLTQALAHAINCHSAENGSNTPDFILAEYLADCLSAFDKAVTAREKWYGRDEAARREAEGDGGIPADHLQHALDTMPEAARGFAKLAASPEPGADAERDAMDAAIPFRGVDLLNAPPPPPPDLLQRLDEYLLRLTKDKNTYAAEQLIQASRDAIEALRAEREAGTSTALAAFLAKRVPDAKLTPCNTDEARAHNALRDAVLRGPTS